MTDPTPPSGQLRIYEDGASRLRVRIEGRTVWLTQAQMAELYQTTPQNITTHLKTIYEEGELDEGATCKPALQVRQEGGRSVERSLKHYNLDAILAVGYRVRSARGTAFRRWATATLGEYLVKGFAMDDERLEAGKSIGGDYFDELLERIRAIRASEKRFYQKITDIYATSIDYDASAAATKAFFATVQNKLHYAVHGHTAAEVIVQRADAQKPNMGLTTWKNAPAGPVRKGDVTVAKNYLNKDEITQLDRIVTMYLDYAEDQAKRHNPMHMADWIGKLDAFLRFNERGVLADPGTVSKALAEEHAHRQFERHDGARRLREASEPSDFDRFVEEAERISGRPGERDGGGR
jgi:hypothetical protein